HTDEEWSLMFRSVGALLPDALQRFEQGECVLAGTEAGFHTPSRLANAAAVFAGLFGVLGLLACELVFDGDGERVGMELLHTQPHGSLVQQLVRDRPGAFLGAKFGAKDVGVAQRFLNAGVDRSAVVACRRST